MELTTGIGTKVKVIKTAISGITTPKYTLKREIRIELLLN